MADDAAVETLWQKREERRHVVGVERFCGRELPEDRAELRLQLEQAARKEPLDRRAGLGEHAPVRGVARPLEREYEIGRRLLGPAPKAGGLLGAVEGAID